MIRGPLVARLRNRLAMTQRELGAAIGVGETRVRHIERKDEVGVYAPTFRKLADATKMTVDALRREIGVAETDARQVDFEAGVGAALRDFVRTKAQEEGETPAAPPFDDRSVEPYSERPLLAEIPLFELSVACGTWTDVSEVEDVLSPAQIEQGLFRVRLAGDSMTPEYRAGQVVEFRCVRVGHDGLVAGRDYYIQRADGCATFKRVERFDDDVITLRALNKKKYPKALTVERGLVVRMALAVARVEML